MDWPVAVNLKLRPWATAVCMTAVEVCPSCAWAVCVNLKLITASKVCACKVGSSGVAAFGAAVGTVGVSVTVGVTPRVWFKTLLTVCRNPAVFVNPTCCCAVSVKRCCTTAMIVRAWSVSLTWLGVRL